MRGTRPYQASLGVRLVLFKAHTRLIRSLRPVLILGIGLHTKPTQVSTQHSKWDIWWVDKPRSLRRLEDHKTRIKKRILWFSRTANQGSIYLTVTHLLVLSLKKWEPHNACIECDVSSSIPSYYTLHTSQQTIYLPSVGGVFYFVDNRKFWFLKYQNQRSTNCSYFKSLIDPSVFMKDLVLFDFLKFLVYDSISKNQVFWFFRTTVMNLRITLHTWRGFGAGF